MLLQEAPVRALRTELNGLSVVESLKWLCEQFPGQVSFSTSFGLEDQVVSHYILENDLPIRVFTLDTGRNFQETYSTWARTMERYGRPIEVFYPNATDVQHLLNKKGPNSFYESVENRKECCFIRKVAPLRLALENQQVWVTGIRAGQSNNRQTMENVEWDEGFGLVKFHPIFEWTFEQAMKFVKENNIPYNPLHDKGFVSIGCAPCTRAIRPGEDFRAGRWWWEDASKKECGLHAR